MYDVAIIGSGPAGISCAKNALRYKLKPIIIERDISSFGGICLTKGCIPTKFFLNSSKTNTNWSHVHEKKNELVATMQKPLLHSLQSAGVDIAWAEATFLDAKTIKVGEREISAHHIIIASGAYPQKIAEGKNVLYAEDIFDCAKIGEKFLIVGAGYTGMELASLLNAFGKKVWVVEKEEGIIPFFDSYLAGRLKIILEKKGIRIDVGKTLSDCNQADFDNVIIAVGRHPNTKNLGLERVGVETKRGGWVKTDEYMRTNIENIYACGDVTGAKLLAYIAEYQGQLCIHNILGKNEKADYSKIPECVFSVPQIAKVGVLEEEAKAKNLKYRVIKSNFLRYSCSYVYGDMDGFIEILLDKSDRIIGAGIISQFASELISVLSLSMRNNLSLADLKKNIFIHPTLSEIIPSLLRDS
ncbi:MAG: NAD(P)/FAD-dependent oxidoreductase [Candidatus Omnitrophota bacterium]|nr:MAG: NAD(P)/FAD-dependent oxidoreductase [Candidatus Omnitrophota bacterium]